jgi:hypothetical protein
MTLRTTDTWRGRCRGTPEQAIATFARWGSFPIEDVADATREIYRLCQLVGLDASLLVAHAALETGSAVVGRGFLDKNWATVDAYRSPQNRYNIAGIGITDTIDHGFGFRGGLNAARAFVVHHAVYELPVSDPAWEHLEPYINLDPRYGAVPNANRGAVRTVADMTGKWWTNPVGHSSLVQRGNAIFPGIPDQQSNQQETQPVATKTYSTVIPGLPGGPLVTFYPIKIKLVPTWRTLNRPGLKAKHPRVEVQHGNGNPDSSAAGEATYLYNGAGGRQASYHAASDDKEVWIMIPADEVTWQAADGSGPGNMRGFSCEMVEDDDLWADAQRRVQCMAITGDLMGRVAARLNIAKPQMHWDFNFMNAPSRRHHCVDTFLDNDAFWQNYQTVWRAAKVDEQKRMEGTVPTVPSPGQTSYVAGDILTNTAAVNLRQAASTVGNPITVLAEQTRMVVERGPIEGDGWEWYWVSTPAGRGYVAEGDWIVKTGYQDPSVKGQPVNALLDTDLEKYDTAEGIVSDENGTEFVFVADVIEVTAKDGLDAYVYADRSTVLRHLDKGERFVAAWVFKYQDEFFYLEPADDWGRIPYEGTKRVSDAPLKVRTEEDV